MSDMIHFNQPIVPKMLKSSKCPDPEKHLDDLKNQSVIKATDPHCFFFSVTPSYKAKSLRKSLLIVAQNTWQ